jgi:hypothetical protein
LGTGRRQVGIADERSSAASRKGTSLDLRSERARRLRPERPDGGGRSVEPVADRISALYERHSILHGARKPRVEQPKVERPLEDLVIA